MKKPRSRRAKATQQLPQSETVEEFLARVARMTPEQIFETAVAAGIYTKSGRLRKLYAPQPDDS